MADEVGLHVIESEEPALQVQQLDLAQIAGHEFLERLGADGVVQRVVRA
ncbi:MAG: hypothetical protein IPJ41_01985 [Phycisphaerales bacterium]|nr:hypothetical protein [Phycisphaerales bacterium]